ncbi:MAG TPA: beta-ketoacyl synthase N-terminal-like domain-containing protein [Streptosporangiaceae bacterium]|nr:beta-ketoacyl synthase N-terminal-like domain-containing protein [Streptosporangiaceae bacterium]
MAENFARVAVIGMAGRFPGGGGIDEFWANLAGGRESLTWFGNGDEAVPRAAAGIVPDGDMFDAGFFGYAPSEALLIDPQHRVFLECAWEALEHAGHDPQRYQGAIGVYGGCGDTGYLEQLRTHAGGLPEVSELQLRLATSVDFLTSRVAYKLGLTGPAVTVQTACSTSLVAVHTAAQALLAGECDMALAGGITLHVPFPHEEPGEDGITAADGHCRAFDIGASGTIASDGAGVVVLKRLDEAQADGDTIYAVILGSAVTNDGLAKVGFTAPGVDGIAAAVRGAQVLADVDPASIDYVEAHGTGTAVGDPIEVRGLTKAFGLTDGKPGTVLLGAVKTNIGHTDIAAGVHGLMKVVLAMRHELIPGTLHFTAPNPALDLTSSPFLVTAQPVPWPPAGRPRRAGVSSMGLGGTNAHVVLEEAPPGQAIGHQRAGDHHILPLSARSQGALSAVASALADHLGRHADVPLADVGWTLQVGRRPFAWRGFVVADSTAQAARALTGDAPALVTSPDPAPDEARGAVFMFPGQGGQHVGMAAGLYRRYPAFRADIDACADLAADVLGLDVRRVLFPDRGDQEAARVAERRISEMPIAQPVVFAVQYALARLWQSWGVRPVAVVGHSLGAYAAAAIAGVLSLSDAMTLVIERGRLLGGMRAGAMLAVPLPARDVERRLGPDLSLAVINGPAQCVVAGSASAVTTLQSSLAAEGIDSQVLHISAAAHSHLIEPSLPAFEKVVASVTLHEPVLDWISDRTGRQVTRDEATSPSYWSAHLRHTINFSAALETVLANRAEPLLEVGPGRTLSGLARQHPACPADRTVVPSMPHAADDVPGEMVLLTAAGRLWQAGVPIDWTATHGGSGRRRVPLPTYPFERRRFRIGEPLEASQPEDAGSAGSVGSPGSAVSVSAGPAWDSTTQAAVADAFQSILGIERIDGNRNFFDLGGDSLLAARVAAILRRELGVTIGVRSIFLAPTVIGLATLLDEGQARQS